MMRDELGPLFSDTDFITLFSRQGQTGVSPAILAMVTLMQYMEGLTDRQAADAVRGRIDWKYVLGGAFHFWGKREILGYKTTPEVRYDEKDEARFGRRGASGGSGT